MKTVRHSRRSFLKTVKVAKKTGRIGSVRKVPCAVGEGPTSPPLPVTGD